MLYLIELIFGSYPFIFCASITGLGLKACLVYYLMSHLIHRTLTKKIKRSCLYLIGVLVGSILVDSTWVLKIAQTLFLPSLPDYVVRLWIRIGWASSVVQYQFLALALESLINKNNKLTKHSVIYVSVSTVFFFIFLSIGILEYYGWSIAWGYRAMQIWILYALFPLMLSSIGYVTWRIYTLQLPHILKKQLKIIIRTFIIPYLVCDFIQTYPFVIFPEYIASNFAVIGISTLLLTYALYTCVRRIIGLRFLNLNNHVQHITQFNFIDRFKDVLEQLSLATTLKELGHITQALFKDSFTIPLNRTNLYIRSFNQKKLHEQSADINKIETIVETFLHMHKDIEAHLHDQKLLITDEIELSNFYEEETQLLMIQFLEALNADIFFPIYNKSHLIIAYIIVDRHARTDHFYSNIERDEMLIFGSYLANIINLLNNQNMEKLIKNEKMLKEELYSKHQEINQYKESIQSFIAGNKQKAIGVIFYKNRRFTFANQAAKELIKININQQEGHALTKSLLAIARNVEEYKSPQTSMCTDTHGNKLILSGVPNIEQNNVIITVYPPEVTDIVKQQINYLQDPNKWDYLLYLETTQAGHAINQLIPSTGRTFLNFKIELLQASLSKKALLLNIPEEDLIPIVEIVHHISLRETLHILKLQGFCENYETAQKLFGINPLLTMNTTTHKPLLEKLDNSGTLFIQNIHYLDLESQEYLADFLKYGFFKVFKSDQKIASNVRIICSTNHYLHTRIQEGTFNQNLAHELKKEFISMPSLITIGEEELLELIESFTKHAISNYPPFASLLELTEKEKYKIIHARPASLYELKNKIHATLTHKAKKNDIYQETEFNFSNEVIDPELIQAARLGKHALRDQRIMTLLWNKFKNQNKIATFLGVNRSSINRRCKEYNLH
jgi:hypothetical protein